MVQADKANQAKSVFLSSMSHELRTPLNAILGFAQLIQSGSPLPTPSQKRSIDQILKAGWYLLDLINEVLDLALIESGKLSLSTEPVSLIEVLKECRIMVEAQALQRKISVTFPDFDIAHFVKVDRTRLKQVIINLLTNAIKYNRIGGTVLVSCIVKPTGRIRICIEDSGQGLSAKDIDQLFQPFNRLGQEMSGQEGTGIGLVTAKRLIELMEGAIGVESDVGNGSVFWIELNLTHERQEVIEAVESEVIAPVKVHDESKWRNVLYIEDNPANLMLVEDLIARQPDIRLLTATDGNRGIEITRASLPDMILMDINLPGISGLQAMKILREDPATMHIPIVALSGNAIPRDIRKGLKAGFFRYLTKPINVSEFMNTLKCDTQICKGSISPRRYSCKSERNIMILCDIEILEARILIVDDQEANVRLIEQLLGDAGYKQVSSTLNSQDVCALHRKHHYDLILLDLQMPEMDGFVVMAGLKTDEADSYLPVIVLTAQPGHKLRALQSGAKGFHQQAAGSARSQDPYPQHARGPVAVQEARGFQRRTRTKGGGTDGRAS